MNTKEQVLALLEQNRGSAVSGETIAQALSVSRNAVWKAIRALRDEGYQIEAGTNRGYSLAAETDILSVSGIRRHLPDPLSEYADRMRFFSEIGSTNETAKELALAGAPHGTAVIAAAQTNGRGRYTRAFCSPAGGIYMSIILHPEHLHFSQITAVTAFAAVAVCEAVEAVSGLHPQIKWVNDIFLGGKKICGILTEAVTDFESGGLSWIVLGIGLNVCTPADAFPPQLRDTAASVFPESAPPDAKNRMAAEILTRLLSPAPAQDALFSAYKARLLMPDNEITVVPVGQRAAEYPALIRDLDSEGHLIVQLRSGEIRTLSSGEIRIRL